MRNSRTGGSAFPTAKRDDRIRQHMNVEHQVLNGDILVRHVDGSLMPRDLAAEGYRVGQVARIGAAADGKGFRRRARARGIDLEKL